MSDVAIEQQEFALPYASPKEIVSIIQAIVIVTNGGESTASSSEIANTATAGIPKYETRISKETISLNLPFLISSGLVKVVESGKYKPSDNAVRFARQLGWDELEAKKLLRQSISKAWYCKLVNKRFQERSVQTAIQLIKFLQQDLPGFAKASLDSFERFDFAEIKLGRAIDRELLIVADASRNYDEFINQVEAIYGPYGHKSLKNYSKEQDEIGVISRDNTYLLDLFWFQQIKNPENWHQKHLNFQFLLSYGSAFGDWLISRRFYSRMLNHIKADPASEIIVNLIGWLIYADLIIWVNEFEIGAGDLSDIAPNTPQTTSTPDIAPILNSPQNLIFAGSQVHTENFISGDTRTQLINISLAINFPIHSWDDLTEANAKRIRDWLKLLAQPGTSGVDQ